jgi:hypothetical protein
MQEGVAMQNIWRSYAFYLILPILFCGCAGNLKGYGSIRPDRNVTKAFEAFQVNSDFNYYYSGADDYPNALIGLEKKNRLEPDNLWKRMASKQTGFKDVIKQMQSRALTIGHSQYGFIILDDQGRQIGVWYSILEAPTAVKMIDERTVLIYTPDLDTYMKHEKDDE